MSAVQNVSQNPPCTHALCAQANGIWSPDKQLPDLQGVFLIEDLSTTVRNGCRLGTRIVLWGRDMCATGCACESANGIMLTSLRLSEVLERPRGSTRREHGSRLQGEQVHSARHSGAILSCEGLPLDA